MGCDARVEARAGHKGGGRVDGWVLVFLGIIATATTAMAALQIGAAIHMHRLSRKMDGVMAELNEEVRPLVGRLNDISSDAARATSLVVTQVERADHLFNECAQRFDQTMGLVQDAVIAPAQEGLALVDGLRAGLAAIRQSQPDQPTPEKTPSEEDDPLFIG